jgi:hypothetical protein
MKTSAKSLHQNALANKHWTAKLFYNLISVQVLLIVAQNVNVTVIHIAPHSTRTRYQQFGRFVMIVDQVALMDQTHVF